MLSSSLRQSLSLILLSTVAFAVSGLSASELSENRMEHLVIKANAPVTEEERADFRRWRDSGVPLERLSGEGTYELNGYHNPLSDAVLAFFLHAEAVLANAEWQQRDYLQSGFDFELGGPGDLALRRAIQDRKTSLPDADKEEQRRRAFEDAHLRNDSATWDRLDREYSYLDSYMLGRVWAQFVEALGGPNSKAMVKVRQKLEHLRTETSSISYGTFDDPTNAIWSSSRAFNAGMRSLSTQTAESFAR